MTPQSRACPQCKAANSQGAQFCRKCGYDLSAAGPAKRKTRGLTQPENEHGGGEGEVREEEQGTLAPGTAIGNWVIGRWLGKGGMGTVYLAHHRLLGRQAAVKALSPALSADPGFRARFQREAMAQAKLDHPHIAHVDDYVEHEGGFYIVMEYLDGTLLDLVRQRGGPLEPDETARLAAEALDGLGYAHRQGIVHRDITSSNVMLDHRGTAKVTDFGIALIAGGPRLTSWGRTLGTPRYMSPEQIRTPQSVDARTDIYSMGIVIYEMLTGQTPFEADTDFSVQEAQVKQAPPPPRRINPRISEGLEKVVLKALEKNPGARYQTCEELSAAIGSAMFEPPKATEGEKRQPPPWPWSRAAMILLGVCALASVGYLVLRPKNETVHEIHEIKDAPGAGLWLAPAQMLNEHHGTVLSVAFSPDGSTLASGSADGTLKFWSTETGAELYTAKGGYTNAVNHVSFSPGGQFLASADQNWTIKWWSVATGEEMASWQAVHGSVASVVFSPNGKVLASIGETDDPIIRLWSATAPNEALGTLEANGWLTGLAFSPTPGDALLLASAGLKGIQMWALENAGAGMAGHAIWAIPAAGSTAEAVAFSPDGNTLASGREHGDVDLWSAANGDWKGRLAGHTDTVNAVAFSPDGKYLASASNDHTVRIWSAATRALLQTLTANNNFVETVAWSPNGQMLASGDVNGTIRLWRRP